MHKKLKKEVYNLLKDGKIESISREVYGGSYFDVELDNGFAFTCRREWGFPFYTDIVVGNLHHNKKTNRFISIYEKLPLFSSLRRNIVKEIDKIEKKERNARRERNKREKEAALRREVEEIRKFVEEINNSKQ